MSVLPAPRPLRRSLAFAISVVAIASAFLTTPEALASGGTQSPAHAGAHRRLTTPALIQRDVEAGHITEVQGARFLTWAFTASSRLPAAYRSSTPWEGTLPLLQLQQIAPDLGHGPAASQVRADVRRFTSLPCRSATSSLPTHTSTRHFFVEYAPAKLRGLKIGAYRSTLEQTWSKEVRSFRWAAPPRDPATPTPSGRYLVRVQALGTGLYGYVTGTRFVGNNPHTSWNDRDAVASCMVLNQNFASFPGTALNAMRATVAHEFNHSLQFGYGALTGPTRVDGSWVEGGATWMEDEVFDTSNDNYNYLWPDIRKPMPLFDPSYPYPYWVVFRAMTEPYGGSGTRTGGQRIFRSFWEQLSRNASTNSMAFNRAFKSVGSSLATAYHDAGIALRFTIPCSLGTTPYCLEEATGYVNAAGPNVDHRTVANGDTETFTLPNDYATHWIGLPSSGSYPITVRVDAGVGRMRVSVACLGGGDTLTITPLGTASAGNLVSVGAYSTTGCNEVTAVVSNVRMTKASPRSKTTTTYEVDLT